MKNMAFFQIRRLEHDHGVFPVGHVLGLGKDGAISGNSPQRTDSRSLPLHRLRSSQRQPKAR